MLPHIAPWPVERGPWPYVPTSGDCYIGQFITPFSILHAPLLLFLVSNAGGLLTGHPTAASWSRTRTATLSQRYAMAYLALPRPPQLIPCSSVENGYPIRIPPWPTVRRSHISIYACAQMNSRRLCRSSRSRNVRELLHHSHPTRPG